MKLRLRWSCHLVTRKNSRIPNQLLYGVLTITERPPYKPWKRYKDLLKASINDANITPDKWEGITIDLTCGKSLCMWGRLFVRNFDLRLKNEEAAKRSITVSFPLICSVFGIPYAVKLDYRFIIVVIKHDK